MGKEAETCEPTTIFSSECNKEETTTEGERHVERGEQEML